MARAYAAALGALAMATTLLRGWRAESDLAATIQLACLSLVAFAIAGAIVGRIAEATVDRSVQEQLEARLAEASANRPAERPEATHV